MTAYALLRICKDCKHFRTQSKFSPEDTRYHCCGHPKNVRIDLVTGMAYEVNTPAYLRKTIGFCDKTGDWHENIPRVA